MSETPAQTVQAVPRHDTENVEKGMLIMATAMLFVPSMDAFAKLLSDTQSAGQVTFSRFLFQSVVLFSVLAITGKLRWPRGQVRPLAAGGVLVCGAIVLIFWALKYMPIPNAIAIFFVEPLILTLFSAVFLGEKVGWRRTSAVVVGLIGALVVIRPNWSAYGWHAVLPLGTAVCFAGYLTIIRHSTSRMGGLATQFWVGVFAMLTVGLLLLLGVAWPVEPLIFHAPGGYELILLVGLGIVATLGHFMIAQAFKFAPASILAPFQYLEIIGATLLGYLIFGDFPDPVTWLGTAIILSAGFYVYLRERRLERLTRRTA